MLAIVLGLFIQFAAAETLVSTFPLQTYKGEYVQLELKSSAKLMYGINSYYGDSEVSSEQFRHIFFAQNKVYVRVPVRNEAGKRLSYIQLHVDIPVLETPYTSGVSSIRLNLSKGRQKHKVCYTVGHVGWHGEHVIPCESDQEYGIGTGTNRIEFSPKAPKKDSGRVDL